MNTVTMYVTGILQLMMPFAIRYTPPIISATAHVSPIQPPMLPKAASAKDGSSATLPAFKSASGVAVVTASAPGVTHPVIRLGYDAKRKARPARAGLIKF
ncbi:hypothetical protein SDC9_192068 [bioreactor metagenome]|uniref:Uncharacterized protein n=1 Tax=bioreactor metagenome TaxID=1076179 RepID=A0A645IAP4_9ZZZZ